MYEFKPGVVLRAGVALLPDARVALVTSDDHYHGGTLFDEVMALASPPFAVLAYSLPAAATPT